MGFITSANSEFTLDVPDVFAGPQTIQGYMVDDAFGAEDVAPTEVRMGVDGIKSSGFTPYLTKILVHLMPDSPSIAVFEQWLGAMAAQREDAPGNASIWAPSLGKAWSCSNGSLTRYKPIPDAKKVFEGQTYEVTFETVTVSAA